MPKSLSLGAESADGAGAAVGAAFEHQKVHAARGGVVVPVDLELDRHALFLNVDRLS